MKKSKGDALSSVIFFTARVKNKREDTKLAYQLKQLERHLGHTFFEINKEIRDLKNELKTTRRSSGRCSADWFGDGDDDNGMSAGERRLPSAGNSGRAASSKLGGSTIERGRLAHRASSAPTSEAARMRCNGIRRTRALGKRHHPNSFESHSNDAETERREDKGKVTIFRRRSSTITSLSRVRPADIFPHLKALEPLTEERETEQDTNQADSSDEVRTGTHASFERSTGKAQQQSLAKRNSWMRLSTTPIDAVQNCNNGDSRDTAVPNESKTMTENQETEHKDSDVERPLLARTQTDRLKPALKSEVEVCDRHVDKPRKTVRIATAESQESEVLEPISQTSGSGSLRNMSVGKLMARLARKETESGGTFVTEAPVSPSPEPVPTRATPPMPEPKQVGGTPRLKSPNVIPDIRKKVLSGEELELKKKRDRLLACSVTALLGGKPLENLKSGNSTEKGEKSKKEQNNRRSSVSSSIGSDDGRTSPAQRRSSLRRRFSFRAISMLSIRQQKSMTVEKKSTLGSRLKIKAPAESISRKIDIKKSVEVQDSDSDEEDVVPIKPAIDLKNVKSKISNQWKQDAVVLDKPPTLGNDLQQLQRSLAASHLTRERDLKAMQEENDVDPMKVIDDNRQSALMSKFRAFNRLMQAGQNQESRRKSVIDAIHSGADGQQILQLFRRLDKKSSQP
ncbi:uncharacterized protein [Diadema setosum]|uniref:uncharacterized protein n=1 Tax=Diadema setosum TaxID=31175 RepID=UPI003B3B50FC